MNLFITADLHLRRDKPPFRPASEDWMKTQMDTLSFLAHLLKSNPRHEMWFIGDIFHSSRAEYEVIHMFIDVFKRYKEQIQILAGNHDLLYHSMENINRAAYGFLYREFDQLVEGNCYEGIVTTHQLVFPDEKSRPFKHSGKIAEELLEGFPEAKWIFTGDYHRYFHYTKDNRHVINPGCVFRQAVDFFDYQPKYCLVNTEVGTVEWFPLPDNEPIDIETYSRVKERENRIGSFIETVKEGKQMEGLNFTDVVKNKMNERSVDKEVRDFLNEIFEEAR